MVNMPIEDRVAIQELTSLYAIYCDTHQLEKYYALFTEDCLFDEVIVGGRRVHSRAELRKMFEDAGDFLTTVMHTCSNHVISAYSGNAASGMCYVLAEGTFKIDGEQKPFRILGYYSDEYVKQNGRWYFKAREIKLLVPSQGAAPPISKITYDYSEKHFAIR